LIKRLPFPSEKRLKGKTTRRHRTDNAAFNFGKGYVGVIQSAIWGGVFVFAISLYAVFKLNETFDKSLDFVEEN